MSSALVQQTRAAERRREPVADKLYAEGTAFSLALADRVGIDRFIRAAVTSFKTTPKLAQCTWDSVVGGLYVAAQLGLEVGGPRGLAYLVPYGKEAQLVIGVRGFQDLMYRAGAQSVDAFIVREGDQFRIGANSDAGRFYEWIPQDLDDSRKALGVVAQVRTATGGLVWEYMTEPQVLARRPKYWQSTPWNGPFWDQMWLKTGLRQVAKRVRQSTEVALAVDSDQTVQRRLAGVDENQVQHVELESAAPQTNGQEVTQEESWEERERREHAEWAAGQEEES